MNIYIVIVNYCGASDTVAAINSIIKASNKVDVNCHIIVVDNKSPKNGNDIIQKTLDILSFDKSTFQGLECCQCIIDKCKIIFIQNEKNAGFGAGNNIGISYVKNNAQHLSNSDVLLLLNNDTEVEEDFIQNVLKYNRTHEKRAFSVKSINYFTKEIDSEGFGYINLVTGRSSHLKDCRFSYLVGSCIILNYISDIPFFDEKFFLYYEDADYSALLRENGYPLSYDSTNKFYHKVSASSKLNPFIERIKKESMIRFMRKNASVAQNVIFFLVRFGVYVLKFRLKDIKQLIVEYARPL